MSASWCWILSGVRTPFAKSGTALRRVPVYELGRVAVAELLARHDLDPGRIDEVILGNCAQPAEAANVARVTALRAGVPESVPGFTVHRNCASGMEAVADGALRIRSGEARLVVAGGMESMSLIPLQFGFDYSDWLEGLMRARTPLQRLAALSRFRPRMLAPRITLMEGLTDLVCGLNMGQTAEELSREFRIPRERQDEFALMSHQRAVAARERLREEIVPLFPAPDFGMVRDDVGPRESQTLEALAKLKPYFDRRNGTVTVGNSCPVTDGAVALLLGDDAAARSWSTPPLGRLRAFAFAGLSPRRMGLGPVFAMSKVLARERLGLEDCELFEINEAFAAQVIPSAKHLGIDWDKLNVHGGAIALGHPFGQTGARIMTTLLNGLEDGGKTFGLESMCVGGGQGMAMIVERLS